MKQTYAPGYHVLEYAVSGLAFCLEWVGASPSFDRIEFQFSQEDVDEVLERGEGDR